jgi:hypothetical protein
LDTHRQSRIPRRNRVGKKGDLRVSTENPLGLLRGAPEIARAIGVTPRRAYWLLERGVLPATKEGNIWVSTLDRLRRFYEGDYLGAGHE